MHELTEASDRAESKASDTCKSAVRLQWESTEMSMWDDELYHQAEHDQTDIADIWDAIMIQKHQMWEDWFLTHDLTAEFWESDIIC